MREVAEGFLMMTGVLVAGGVITVDMSVGFIAPGTGKVFAEARVLHGGRSTCFCEAEAKDDDTKS